MQRSIFNKFNVDGFKLPVNTSKVECISLTSGGRRLFTGNSDGALNLYECRPDSQDSSSKFYNFISISYLKIYFFR